MALIHKATVNPSKLELLAAWLPGNPWYQAASGELSRIASYRFDDPDGEVGVETLLVRAGDGPIFQVPLTYRSAPLAGAEQWLVGTTEHSVLGTRWVYDGCGDPVYATTLSRAILADTGQAEQQMEVDGRVVTIPPSMTISSTATPAAAGPVDEVAGVPLGQGAAGPADEVAGVPLGHGAGPVDEVAGVPLGRGAAGPAAERIRRVTPGDPTVIETDNVELAVVRRIGRDPQRTGAVLSWVEGEAPLAYASVS